MPGNDFHHVYQCLQIPAREKPEFFAVGAARNDARTDALRDRLTGAAIAKRSNCQAQQSQKARLLGRAYVITSFLAVLDAGGVRAARPKRRTDYHSGDAHEFYSSI